MPNLTRTAALAAARPRQSRDVDGEQAPCGHVTGGATLGIPDARTTPEQTLLREHGDDAGHVERR